MKQPTERVPAKFPLAILGSVIIAAAVLLLIFALSAGRHSRSDQVLVITAADAAVGDDFGRSVAMSDRLLLVGAPFDDDQGSGSGSVYGFDAASGEQRFKLTAADAAADHWFGWSVALCENIALVGARNDNRAAAAAGAAYLFDVSAGKQLRKLTASDDAPQANFGRSVAVSRKWALVGAMTAPVGKNDIAGAAYVFDVDSGTQLVKLTSANEGELFFGSSVAISGSTALVAAKSVTPAGNPQAIVYVFDLATGKQLGKLIASAPAVFTVPLALDSDRAVVGTPGGGPTQVFDLASGARLCQLATSNETSPIGFGASVAVGGNTVVVGAVRDNDHGSSSGAAYLFDATTGRQIAKLAAPDAAAGDYFGMSVAIDGNAILVAAPFKHLGGSVYLYRHASEPASSGSRRLGWAARSFSRLLCASTADVEPD